MAFAVDNALSNGHGCMLQYALLHLFGYDLSLDDLKAFRVSFVSATFLCQQSNGLVC